MTGYIGSIVSFVFMMFYLFLFFIFLFLLLLFRKFGVLRVLVFLLGILGISFLCLGSVHGLSNLHRGLVQCFLLGVDQIQVFPVLNLLSFSNCLLDLGLGFLIQLIAVVRDGFLSGVDQRIDFVLGFNELAFLGVVLGV